MSDNGFDHSPESDGEFKHRKNKDGSIDSICLRCFQTAASTYDQSLLGSLESLHSCGKPDTQLYKLTLRYGSRSDTQD
jgi:hypothetical protein